MPAVAKVNPWPDTEHLDAQERPTKLDENKNTTIEKKMNAHRAVQ